MQNFTNFFESLSLEDNVQFIVILDGAEKHISKDRLRVLDRLARFQPYGYTTTGEDFDRTS